MCQTEGRGLSGRGKVAKCGRRILCVDSKNTFSLWFRGDEQSSATQKNCKIRQDKSVRVKTIASIKTINKPPIHIQGSRAFQRNLVSLFQAENRGGCGAVDAALWSQRYHTGCLEKVTQHLCVYTLSVSSSCSRSPICCFKMFVTPPPPSKTEKDKKKQKAG